MILIGDRQQYALSKSKLISNLVLFGLGLFFNYSYSTVVTKKEIAESFILLVIYLYLQYFKNLKIQSLKIFFKVPDHKTLPNSFAYLKDIYSSNELDINLFPIPIFCGDYLNNTCAHVAFNTYVYDFLDPLDAIEFTFQFFKVFQIPFPNTLVKIKSVYKCVRSDLKCAKLCQTM